MRRKLSTVLPAIAVLATGISAGPAALAAPAAPAAPAAVAVAQSPYERGPAPTESSVRARRGPFAIQQVAASGATGFGGGTIYFPTDTSQGTFGGVAVSPGFVSPEIAIGWLGPRLASQGFVVLTMSTNGLTDFPDSRGTQLLAALDYLTSRSPAQVRQRLDANRLAVMGHSMGGGGTLRAAASRSSLQAAIPLAPWHTTTNWSSVRVPTMIMGADGDLIAAPSGHARPFFESLNSAPDKAYLELNNGLHLTFTSDNDVVGKFAISWLKRFVDDDTRYDQFLCPGPSTGAELDRYSASCPLG